MTEVRLKISPPWVTYINKLRALFEGDPQITFDFNDDSADPSVVLSTVNADKAAALTKLLPEQKQFGKVTLRIDVHCPTVSNIAFPTMKKLYDTAFDQNAAYAYSVAPAEDGYWYVNFTYVVFKNCVVQFFNDNLNDPHGVLTTLYQEIASEIFEDACGGGIVAFCTDVERKLGMPLGEWP